MEQKLKTMLGEQMFALAAMQVQLEMLTKERDELKASAASAAKLEAKDAE